MTTVIFAPGKLDFVFVIFVSGHIQLRMKHFKMLLKSSVALSCGRASLGNALLFVLLSSSFFFFSISSTHRDLMAFHALLQVSQRSLEFPICHFSSEPVLSLSVLKFHSSPHKTHLPFGSCYLRGQPELNSLETVKGGSAFCYKHPFKGILQTSADLQSPPTSHYFSSVTFITQRTFSCLRR